MEKEKFETVLDGSINDFDEYLEVTSTENIKKDIRKLQAKYADKGAIKEAIETLKKLLEKE